MYKLDIDQGTLLVEERKYWIRRKVCNGKKKRFEIQIYFTVTLLKDIPDINFCHEPIRQLFDDSSKIKIELGNTKK